MKMTRKKTDLETWCDRVNEMFNMSPYRADGTKRSGDEYGPYSPSILSIEAALARHLKSIYTGADKNE